MKKKVIIIIIVNGARHQGRIYLSLRIFLAIIPLKSLLMKMNNNWCPAGGPELNAMEDLRDRLEFCRRSCLFSCSFEMTELFGSSKINTSQLVVFGSFLPPKFLSSRRPRRKNPTGVLILARLPFSIT
jgi:hypothetical protein